MKFDNFNNGGICSLSSEGYFEKRKIPSELVGAVIRAREASEAQKRFQEELKRYLDKCQRKKLRPKSQWINLLKWISEGKEMIGILDALQIHPKTEGFLKILESLKAHGFPDYFLNSLISEIPSDFLSDEAKENFRKHIPIKVMEPEERRIPQCSICGGSHTGECVVE